MQRPTDRVDNRHDAPGSRTARYSIQLTMSVSPPIFFKAARNKVEISHSAGCMSTRMMKGLLPEDHQCAADSEEQREET